MALHPMFEAKLCYLQLQRMAFNNNRDLVCHPVVLKMLEHKWELFAKKALLGELIVHVLLTALWIVATVAWGPAIEVLPNMNYDLSRGVSIPGGWLHALVVWLFFTLCTGLLAKELFKLLRSGHLLRELRSRDLWW